MLCRKDKQAEVGCNSGLDSTKRLSLKLRFENNQGVVVPDFKKQCLILSGTIIIYTRIVQSNSYVSAEGRGFRQKLFATVDEKLSEPSEGVKMMIVLFLNKNQ